MKNLVSQYTIISLSCNSDSLKVECVQAGVFPPAFSAQSARTTRTGIAPGDSDRMGEAKLPVPSMFFLVQEQ